MARHASSPVFLQKQKKINITSHCDRFEDVTVKILF